MILKVWDNGERQDTGYVCVDERRKFIQRKYSCTNVNSAGSTDCFKRDLPITYILVLRTFDLMSKCRLVYFSKKFTPSPRTHPKNGHCTIHAVERKVISLIYDLQRSTQSKTRANRREMPQIIGADQEDEEEVTVASKRFVVFAVIHFVRKLYDRIVNHTTIITFR